ARGAEETAERQPCGARAELPPESLGRRAVRLALHGVGPERALAARRREGAVVEPEEVDRVEVEAARVAHAERAASTSTRSTSSGSTTAPSRRRAARARSGPTP